MITIFRHIFIPLLLFATLVAYVCISAPQAHARFGSGEEQIAELSEQVKQLQTLLNQLLAARGITEAVGGAPDGYDIIVVAGQSNAIGSANGLFDDPNANDAIDARIWQLGRYGSDDGEVVPATSKIDGTVYDALQHWGLGRWDDIGRRRAMGFTIPFARRYVVDHLEDDRAVLIIPAAYGGTSILKWLGELNVPTTTPRALYDDTHDRIEEALNLPGDNKIVGFLWHQGETDSLYADGGLHGMTLDVYEQKLTDLFNELRDDFPSDPPYPIVAGEFAPEWVVKYPIRKQMEQVITTVLGRDINATLASSDGLASESNFPASATHFSPASLVLFGERYYRAWEGIKQ